MMRNLQEMLPFGETSFVSSRHQAKCEYKQIPGKQASRHNKTVPSPLIEFTTAHHEKVLHRAQYRTLVNGPWWRWWLTALDFEFGADILFGHHRIVVV